MSKVSDFLNSKFDWYSISADELKKRRTSEEHYKSVAAAWQATTDAYFAKSGWRYVKRYLPIPFRIIRMLRDKHDHDILAINEILLRLGLKQQLADLQQQISDNIANVHATHAYLLELFNNMQLLNILDAEISRDLKKRINRLGKKIHAENRITNIHKEETYSKLTDKEKDELPKYFQFAEKVAAEFYQQKHKTKFKKKAILAAAITFSILVAISEAAIAFYFSNMGVLVGLFVVLLPALLLDFYLFKKYTISTFKDLFEKWNENSRDHKYAMRVIVLFAIATSLMWAILTFTSLTHLAAGWLASTALPAPLIAVCVAFAIFAFINNFAMFYNTGMKVIHYVKNEHKKYVAHYENQLKAWKEANPGKEITLLQKIKLKIKSLGPFLARGVVFTGLFVVGFIIAASMYAVSAGVFHTQTILFLQKWMSMSAQASGLFAYMVTQLFAQPLNGIFYILAILETFYNKGKALAALKLQTVKTFFINLKNNIVNDPRLILYYIGTFLWNVAVILCCVSNAKAMANGMANDPISSNLMEKVIPNHAAAQGTTFVFGFVASLLVNVSCAWADLAEPQNEEKVKQLISAMNHTETTAAEPISTPENIQDPKTNSDPNDKEKLLEKTDFEKKLDEIKSRKTALNLYAKTTNRQLPEPHTLKRSPSMA